MKRISQIAKENLIKLVLNNVIYIQCGGWDKYGRLLVTPFTSKEGNICDWMIKNKYANHMMEEQNLLKNNIKHYFKILIKSR